MLGPIVKSLTGFCFASVLICSVSGESRALSGYAPRVFVDCSCDDIVGGNLCYAVKEKIRASSGFRLSEQTPDIGIAVHLVCIDDAVGDEQRGNASAVSVAYATYAHSAITLEYYESSTVVIVGTNRIGEVSTSIVSEVDKVAADNANYFALCEREKLKGK
jgi:hypothetical protein